jgi:peptidoglycan/xylan/chitin deacetylase (PgdA/CDA1 family)
MAWDGIRQWLGGPHERELLPLSWEQLGALAEGGWELGSHTVRHPHLTQLVDGELARELAESRRMCEERLARPCATIAYPYGDVDARVAEAAAAAGYSAGAALPAAPHAPRRLEWPRVGVWHVDDDRRFRIKASRAVRTLRTSLTERRPVSPGRI